MNEEPIKKNSKVGKLALYRRVGEKILIGDRIMVEVIRVQGSAVRLHVYAPKTVKISRAETAGSYNHFFDPEGSDG